MAGSLPNRGGMLYRVVVRLKVWYRGGAQITKHGLDISGRQYLWIKGSILEGHNRTVSWFSRKVQVWEGHQPSTPGGLPSESRSLLRSPVYISRSLPQPLRTRIEESGDPTYPLIYIAEK